MRRVRGLQRQREPEVAGVIDQLGQRVADGTEAIIAELTTKICDASLSGRLGQVTVECAPRRRTRGLLQAVFSRVLIPTADWSKPWDTERVTARAAAGRMCRYLQHSDVSNAEVVRNWSAHHRARNEEDIRQVRGVEGYLVDAQSRDPARWRQDR